MPPDRAPLRMPDFCTTRRGVRQTLDSALPALLRLGVDNDRIVIESAGAGWNAGTVVRQHPPAGAALTPQTRVVLGIAGAGALMGLPFPLREQSETEFLAARLFGLFDNPIEKLAHHLREGGGYLELHPGDTVGALRWIQDIFAVDASPWPKPLWFSMALLLPTLHRVAGREDGIVLGCRVVFGLPVRRVRIVTGIAPFEDRQLTRLGTANTRLGVDAVVGAGMLAEFAVEIDFGPITLEQYLDHVRPDRQAQRQALYRLILPAHVGKSVVERWHVGTRDAPGHLGEAERGGVLGVNCYLGPER